MPKYVHDRLIGGNVKNGTNEARITFTDIKKKNIEMNIILLFPFTGENLKR